MNRALRCVVLESPIRLLSSSPMKRRRPIRWTLVAAASIIVLLAPAVEGADVPAQNTPRRKENERAARSAFPAFAVQSPPACRRWKS